MFSGFPLAIPTPDDLTVNLLVALHIHMDDIDELKQVFKNEVEWSSTICQITADFGGIAKQIEVPVGVATYFPKDVDCTDIKISTIESPLFRPSQISSVTYNDWITDSDVDNIRAAMELCPLSKLEL